jgi:restriction system protein
MASGSSSLPPQAAFFFAILKHLAARSEGDQRAGIHEAMPELLNMTVAQKTERLPNLPHLRYRHRSGWGLSILKAAGYVESPSRGLWRITERGRSRLAAHPDGFDLQTGRRIISESNVEQRERVEPSRPEIAVVEAQNDAGITPDERIDIALRQLNATVAEELLEQMLRMPPASFESLVLDVLHALGYGAGEDDLHRVGGSGDGGIDGIIALDRLGFEKIYVQAKRWQGSVGRPEIQAFCGALSGRRAKKGVFITTSTFTREALGFESQLADTVVLIDGARLASLMIEKGVAVTHYRTVRLPRLDIDYFESE